uniref:Uncharacterized protein n=1 Tax=Arundo donax TaxID=35708 RepID=A0A0A9GLS9_ARUDO
MLLLLNLLAHHIDHMICLTTKRRIDNDTPLNIRLSISSRQFRIKQLFKCKQGGNKTM